MFTRSVLLAVIIECNFAVKREQPVAAVRGSRVKELAGDGSEAPTAAAEAEPLQLTLQAAAQIRGLIIDRVLLPGEKILQVELAERIGVSRSPLREALRTLESEGVVAYEANRGYVVARVGDDDLAQIYRMRALIEDELLRTVRRPDAAVLSELQELNDKLMASIDQQNVAAVQRYNREFHFAIFDLSPLGQMRKEVARLWQMTDIYSAAWWRRQPEAKKRIGAEHKAIISALRKFDLVKLVEICATHRTGGLERSLTSGY
jgi:DNA-binding GntR family transcriptional regulator